MHENVGLDGGFEMRNRLRVSSSGIEFGSR
jgi:hypothetical protein